MKKRRIDVTASDLDMFFEFVKRNEIVIPDCEVYSNAIYIGNSHSNYISWDCYPNTILKDELDKIIRLINTLLPYDELVLIGNK